MQNHFDRKGFIFFAQCVTLGAALVFVAREVPRFLSLLPQNFAIHIPYLAESETQKAEALEIRTIPQPIPDPKIFSRAYLVGDLDTGEVYGEKDGGKALPIASLTKLLTAIVAEEKLGDDTIIKIPTGAFTDSGSNARLREKLSVNELLYPLLMESSNEVAIALADSYGANRFVGSMNTKASGLGMLNTSFADSSGINPGNTSSSRDLFTLAQHIFKTEAHILEITKSLREEVAPNDVHQPHVFKNINNLSRNDDFLGGKTGLTAAAKETMLSLYKYETPEKTYHIAIIVLGSDDKKKDTINLLEWFREKVRVEIAAK